MTPVKFVLGIGLEIAYLFPIGPLQLVMGCPFAFPHNLNVMQSPGNPRHLWSDRVAWCVTG
jgi:hypothetical protein